MKVPCKVGPLVSGFLKSKIEANFNNYLKFILI